MAEAGCDVVVTARREAEIEAVVLLSSPASSWITGETVLVDGDSP